MQLNQLDQGNNVPKIHLQKRALALGEQEWAQEYLTSAAGLRGWPTRCLRGQLPRSNRSTWISCSVSAGCSVANEVQGRYRLRCHRPTLTSHPMHTHTPMPVWRRRSGCENLVNQTHNLLPCFQKSSVKNAINLEANSNLYVRFISKLAWRYFLYHIWHELISCCRKIEKLEFSSRDTSHDILVLQAIVQCA